MTQIKPVVRSHHFYIIIVLSYMTQTENALYQKNIPILLPTQHELSFLVLYRVNTGKNNFKQYFLLKTPKAL